MDFAVLGVAVGQVLGVEVAQIALLAVKKLHHLHAGNVLLQIGIKPRQARAQLAIGAHGEALQVEGRDGDDRDHCAADQGELKVDIGHEADDGQQGEQVHKDRDDALAEKLVEGIDVVGGAGHNTAQRRAVEVAQRQLLQVGKQVAAHVVHDALTDHAGDQGLGVLSAVLHGNAAKEGRDHPPQSRPVADGDVVVNRYLRDIGPDLAEASGEGNGAKGEDHVPPVGLEIPQQLQRQPQIEGALLDFFFFVEFGAHSVSSSARSCWCWYNSA